MIRINLLPHREEKRKARRQQFFALLAVVLLLGAITWFVGFTVIEQRAAEQEARNAFLKSEIASLEKEIAEIQKLKQQTDALLSRKRIIEQLQSNRTESVHLFNELALQVPEGVFLRSIKQNGRKITISGAAQSNARVTTLMNNLNATDLLEKSRLIETKAEGTQGKRLNAFSIEVEIAVAAAVEAVDVGAGSKGAGKGTGKKS